MLSLQVLLLAYSMVPNDHAVGLLNFSEFVPHTCLIWHYITPDALKNVPKTVVKHYLVWYDF